MTEPGRLFCFGLGYSAGVLARRLRAEGWPVAGTSREAAARADLAAQGIAAQAFDREMPLADPAAVLAGSSHVLLSIPPDTDGDPVFDRHADDLAALPTLRWLGYLSTTGVYGDHGGGWVDEATPTAPVNTRGAWRVRAETAWLDLWRGRGLPVHIFRLAGIYGPGRNQFEALRRGTARRIVKPGQVFSRIHVDDLGSVLRASMARPDPGAVYNVCDDEAAPPQDVVAHAAALLNIEPPPEIPFDQAELSAMGRSFYGENKRVRNDRIKHDLGVGLRYPSFREGLAAILAAEDAAR
ncbi:MAG: SDR family oxidoreductase [Alphaproteobacteria bacterium]|jgi:nucleoside-diphosphate-sugar epimerase|nr:SDR family oxidoreductase [Alphaproteobacteria bacterium]MDP6813698.1 SDR family oxidoreductase [Alphaproteobacteria bacterium]